MTFLNEIRIKTANSSSSDASGRFKISTATPIGSYKTLYDKNTLLIDEKLSGGTSTHQSTTSTVDMTVNANTQYVIRQTRQRHHYISGQSKNVECTFANFNTQANVTKRLGYFTDGGTAPYSTNFDGFWIEDDGTTKYFKAQRGGTSVTSDAITSWTGYSKYNLASYNWTNFGALRFDFVWLGGITLRVMLVINGVYEIVHQVNYAGNVTAPFIKTPQQPVRAEIRSSGGTGTFTTVCWGVQNDDGAPENPSIRSYAKGVSTLNANTSGTFYVVCALRKQSTKLDAFASVLGASAIITTADSVIFHLIKNPTLSAGSLSYSSITNSCLEAASGDGTQQINIATGFILETFYGNNNNVVSEHKTSEYSNLYGGIDATDLDTIMLVASPVAGSAAANVTGELTFVEYL